MKWIFTFVFLLCYLSIILGQVSFTTGNEGITERAKDNLLSTLLDKGLQNLAAVEQDSTLYLTFENRVYRSDFKLLQSLTEAFAKDTYFQFEHVEVTIQNRGLPIIKTSFSNANFAAENKVNGLFTLNHSVLADYKEWKQRFGKKQTNKGQYRAEIEIGVQLKLALGAQRDPILHQVSLLPALNLYLWRGAQIKLQGLVPLSDELDIVEEQFWRPRLLVLDQYLPLPKQFLLRASVGYFTERRYGTALELNKFLGKQGQVLLQVRTAYTGFASFPKVLGVEFPEKGWQIGGVNYWTYGLAAEWRIPRWELRTRLEWEKSLLNKEVVRVEVWRQFNELQLGFFAFQYEKQENYGFRIAIPILPKKYAKPGRVHIKPSRYFRYTYHSTQNYATKFSVGEDLWDFYKTLHPGFIQHHISK